jgi:hypothetical protein
MGWMFVRLRKEKSPSLTCCKAWKCRRKEFEL